MRVGRDPSQIARSTALSLSEPFEDVSRNIEELAACGVSYLTVSWPSEGKERLDGFVRDVMPNYAQL